MSVLEGAIRTLAMTLPTNVSQISLYDLNQKMIYPHFVFDHPWSVKVLDLQYSIEEKQCFSTEKEIVKKSLSLLYLFILSKLLCEGVGTGKGHRLAVVGPRLMLHQE